MHIDDCKNIIYTLTDFNWSQNKESNTYKSWVFMSNDSLKKLDDTVSSNMDCTVNSTRFKM